MLNPKPHCTTCPSRSHSVFCDLSHDNLSSLDGNKVTNHYKRGQIVFYEGNPCAGIFCIFSGKIKLYKNGADGKVTILRIASSGDVLGYQNLLSEGGMYATAEVTEDADVCFIDQNYFSQLVKKSPDLAFEIIRKLGQEVTVEADRIDEITNKTVRQRLSRLLLALQKAYGKKHPKGTHLEIKLSRGELASMVSATPETVIRLLSNFAEQNYLLLEGKEIIICDAIGLAQETAIDI
jgi:CRP/FNR family transcriptional regulator